MTGRILQRLAHALLIGGLSVILSAALILAVSILLDRDSSTALILTGFYYLLPVSFLIGVAFGLFRKPKPKS